MVGTDKQRAIMSRVLMAAFQPLTQVAAPSSGGSCRHFVVTVIASTGHYVAVNPHQSERNNITRGSITARITTPFSLTVRARSLAEERGQGVMICCFSGVRPESSKEAVKL